MTLSFDNGLKLDYFVIMRHLFILPFLFLSFQLMGQSSSSSLILGKTLHELRTERNIDKLSFIHELSPLQFKWAHSNEKIFNDVKQPQPILSKGYEAFFCKMEFKLEQKTKIPFRFRLGTLDYVDRLEQK